MPLPLISEGTLASTLASIPDLSRRDNIFATIERENPNALKMLSIYVNSCAESDSDIVANRETVHAFFAGAMVMYYLLRRQVEADDLDRDFAVAPEPT